MGLIQPTSDIRISNQISNIIKITSNSARDEIFCFSAIVSDDWRRHYQMPRRTAQRHPMSEKISKCAVQNSETDPKSAR